MSQLSVGSASAALVKGGEYAEGLVEADVWVALVAPVLYEEYDAAADDTLL